jgi:hypothetical protein
MVRINFPTIENQNTIDNDPDTYLSQFFHDENLDITSIETGNDATDSFQIDQTLNFKNNQILDNNIQNFETEKIL